MKKAVKKMPAWLLGTLIVFVLCSACDEEDMLDQGPDQNQTAPADPNEVTSSLIFDNMKIMGGTPPAVDASIGADLKINADTIFWTEGVTNRIMVKRPEDVSLKGAWIFVAGSSSYIEAAFREAEETEEIDILYFDFDPDGWELPIAFPIKIIPFDEDGNGVDIIDTEGLMEEPFDRSQGCTFSYTYPHKDPIQPTWWEWVFTEDKANSFFTAPMYPFVTNGTTMGCCVNGQSSQSPNCPNEGTVELNYENYYTIAREVFNLYGGVEFTGISIEITRNFDPGESDFCGNRAGYINDEKYAISYGKWEVNENCQLILDYEHRDPFIYVGSRFRPLSKHYIEEVRGGPDGGSGLRRVYVMRTAIDEGEPVGPWYD